MFSGISLKRSDKQLVKRGREASLIIHGNKNETSQQRAGLAVDVTQFTARKSKASHRKDIFTFGR